MGTNFFNLLSRQKPFLQQAGKVITQKFLATANSRQHSLQAIKKAPVTLERIDFEFSTELLDKERNAHKITAENLMKAEAQLDTILRNTHTAYVLLDVNLNITSCNKLAANLGRQLFEKQPVNDTYHIGMLPPDKLDMLTTGITRTLNGEQLDFEVNAKDPSGKIKWFKIELFAIRSKQSVVSGVMLSITDITEKVSLQQEIANKQHQIADAVINAQEYQQKEIGGELHDNVNQILAASRLYLNMCRGIDSKQEEYRAEADKLIQSAISEIRNLSHAMVSPIAPGNESTALQEALKKLMALTSKTTEIYVNDMIEKFNENIISEKLKISVYRITQELFSNILKYSAARNVTVLLKLNHNNLELVIQDDGRGFDMTKPSKGIGLQNIHTRAIPFNASVEIDSSIGKGCKVRVLFPIPDIPVCTV